jgi:hypothetical protein
MESRRQNVATSPEDQSHLIQLKSEKKEIASPKAGLILNWYIETLVHRRFHDFDLRQISPHGFGATHMLDTVFGSAANAVFYQLYVILGQHRVFQQSAQWLTLLQRHTIAWLFAAGRCTLTGDGRLLSKNKITNWRTNPTPKITTSSTEILTALDAIHRQH